MRTYKNIVKGYEIMRVDCGDVILAVAKKVSTGTAWKESNQEITAEQIIEECENYE